MPIAVQHVRAVLLSAGSHEQVRKSDTVLAAFREFALSSRRRRDRLGVDPRIAERGEGSFELDVSTRQKR